MEKTLGLLLMILVGVLLQRRISQVKELNGVKMIILSLALPATIFVALLSVNLSGDLLMLPIIGIGINLLFLGLLALSIRFFPSINSQRKRSLLMLLPSLAPGLSCFPFISEYLGEEPLALAALLDVGNKVFVLILLYLLAMRWYLKINEISNAKEDGQIKKMIWKMASEPINIVMVVALVLLGFGLNLDSLPDTVANLFLRLSGIMAPLVLLFIGLSVKIQWSQFSLIAKLLTWRAGLAFIFSAVFISLVPNLSPVVILLAVVFPQSSCSFWPFAHMSLISDQEGTDQKTFDIEFSLAVLAISLPFSSILIMAILSFPVQASNPAFIGYLGTALFFLSVLPQTIRKTKLLFKS